MNANYKLTFWGISLLFALSTSISAAPGDLDPTFGNGGIVISTGGSINTLEAALGMALQADGKIVAVGYGAAVGSDTWDFAVVRYNTNGSLDSSFGNNGIVRTPVGNSHDDAYSVAIQADGKIVAVGRSCNGVGRDGCSAGSNFAVVRYNPNGSLDTIFNGTGKVITPINASSIARSVAIQADGKIVVAGDSSGSSGGFTLVRYNTNGSLDTSFDNDGIVTTGVGGAFAVAIEADGKIVAAGTGVVRCNADGSLDTTFNGTGIVTTPGSHAYSVAIQADGKILTTNGFNGFPSENRLVRYNANGTPDTSFNGTGSVAVGIYVNSAVVQADGKIVAAGFTEFGEGSAFAVIRLNGNGSLDATFGVTGTVITPIVDQYYYSSGAGEVAIQPDGKIVAAGGVVDRGFDTFDFALVRYQGDSISPTSCPNPIDCVEFFVRQHYLDFLNREPDPAGMAGWLAVLNNCPPGDTSCDRIHVSSAFFRSSEFQGRGYFVYRFYPVSFGRKPDYDEFTPDLAKVSGFLTDAELETAKQAFIAEFMSRPPFGAKFNGLDNTSYVDTLLTTASITHSARDFWIGALGNGTRTRAQVLREIAESTEVHDKYYNQAFVVMQYFGYLRRQPDALYLNWIVHLDVTGDYRSMINGFMNSVEYRARFGP